MRAIRLHSQGLDGRPNFFLTFLICEYGSPKQWCAITHENSQNEGYALLGARLTFQMGQKSRDGQPYA